VIESTKTMHAIYALHGLLVYVRTWAATNASAAQIVDALDVAEYLCQLMGDKEDRTTVNGSLVP
jgi:hypothetical protein